MQWVAGLTPLMVAAACTAAFFLAGREPKAERGTSAPLPSGGNRQSVTPASESGSFFPEERQELPTLQIDLEWKRPNHFVAPQSSLPIRTVAWPPATAPTTRSSEAEPTSAPTPVSGGVQSEELSDLNPIWCSHWASKSQPRWLLGSDTAQLQRVSFPVPPAIVGGPASSVWWAPGHASLSRSSAHASSSGRNSRHAPIRPRTDYLPPWARPAH